MNSLFSSISGLGWVHYLAPIWGLRQADLVIRQNKPFTGMAYLALGLVAADISCLTAWVIGQADAQSANFWAELLMALIPLPFATVVMFWVQKNRTIKQTLKQLICSDEKDIYNVSVLVCLIGLAFVSLFYFSFDWPERLHACYSSFGSCAVEDRLFGDRHFVYSSITVMTVLIDIYGSALILNLSTIYRNRNLKEPARSS